MKVRITYKELSIILGILVAILAIFSYWLNLQQDLPANASVEIKPILEVGIDKISNFFNATVHASFPLF